jgi:diaminopimelate epimerase
MTVLHMSGAGNRFLLIDDRDQLGAEDVFTPDQVRELAADRARTDGGSIEGLLRIRQIGTSRVEADFYNPDGSRGMLCGNGARCVVRYAADHGLRAHEAISCVFNGMPFRARVYDDATIGIDLPTPLQMRYFAPGSLEAVDVPVWYVDVQSDHAVIIAPQQAPSLLVAQLRHHPDFPRGVNVNMMCITDPQRISLATFERGVEAITGACGTGAVSAAVTMWMRDPSHTRFTVIPPSGRPLEVTIFAQAGHIETIELRGDAVYDHC